jgi:hypothetical protein
VAGALTTGFAVDSGGGDLLEGVVAAAGGEALLEPAGGGAALLDSAGGDGAALDAGPMGEALVLGTTSGRGASLVTVTYTVVGWHSAGATGETAGEETAGADAGGADAAGADAAGADAGGADAGADGLDS